MGPQEGLPADTPRQSLQAALRMGLIDAKDEETWLEMLRDRNLTSHLYQEKLAGEVAGRVTARYLPLLREALSRCHAKRKD